VRKIEEATLTTETAREAAAHGEPSVDETLIRLLTGMWAMQSVAAAARLGVFDALAGGPRSADAVAREIHADPLATRRLLRALAGLGAVALGGDDRFGLTAVGERLREGVPGTFRDAFIAESDRVHWRSWEVLAEAVRTGRPRPAQVFGTPAFDYYSQNREEGEQFGRAMENFSRFVAASILDAYDFSGVRTIMDVGGSNGSLILAILARHPEMKGKIADLPYIEPQAKANIAAAGVAGRCAFEASDFFHKVPGGADLQVMKSILHDWNDEECVRLLRNCRASLEPGGKLLVVEMLVPEAAGPDFVTLMDLNMLVMTGGRERTAREYDALFEAAGFGRARVIPTRSPVALLETRPA
jgi:hypothetical protein